MQFVTTITQKGQVTIPKKFREKAGIKIKDKVEISQTDNGDIKISPAVDILDLAGTFIPKKNKGVDPIRAREYMENNYKRA